MEMTQICQAAANTHRYTEEGNAVTMSGYASMRANELRCKTKLKQAEYVDVLLKERRESSSFNGTGQHPCHNISSHLLVSGHPCNECGGIVWNHGPIRPIF
jgi:hypothetical protein